MCVFIWFVADIARWKDGKWNTKVSIGFYKWHMVRKPSADADADRPFEKSHTPSQWEKEVNSPYARLIFRQFNTQFTKLLLSFFINSSMALIEHLPSIAHNCRIYIRSNIIKNYFKEHLYSKWFIIKLIEMQLQFA